MFSQIAAVAIFVIMFVMIVWDKVERQIVTLLSGLATIVFVFIFGMHSKEAIFNTLNIKAIFTTDFWYHVGQGGEESSGINWATIIFIFGMMVMVEGLAEAGFFNWLCMAIAKLVHYEPIPIFIAFMVMSAVLSMLKNFSGLTSEKTFDASVYGFDLNSAKKELEKVQER